MKRFLGEGGKKRVYLAHDTLLDRDVAFALIKTEGLDEAGLARVRSEAQAMGRLGAHPHIVTVFDIGEETDPWRAQAGPQPYMVIAVHGRRRRRGLIEGADDHRLPLERRGADRRRRSARGWSSRTARASSTATSSPATSGSPRTASPEIGDFGLAVALDRSRLTRPA